MDGQKQTDTPAEPSAAPDTEQRRRIFMDVRKPKAGTTAEEAVKPATESPVPNKVKPAEVTDEPSKADQQPAESTSKATSSVSDPVPPPPEDDAEKTDDPAVKLEEPKKANVTKPPKPPRQPGIGLAIFATVIIVLALSTLATYAYLRSNNIEVF